MSFVSRPDPPPRRRRQPWVSQKDAIFIFSSAAIALYGYDQGMMSLVNTNRSYLRTMGISEDSAVVGIIMSVYYLGCAVGAIIASYWADKKGRKPSISVSLATSMIGNILMFIPGIYPTNSDNEWGGISFALMLTGRVILGLGLGGIDAVIPVYSSELSHDGARGRTLAQEFQVNILGLLVAFGLNIGFTNFLGKESQWAWRAPIIIMQIFPIILLLIINYLPESPRWLVSKERPHDAQDALKALHGESTAGFMLGELQKIRQDETNETIGFTDMLIPNGSQFHPTVITVMGQVNQALTGYGAVSVYGPQTFELLGLDVHLAECASLGNYIFYFAMTTVA
ncbi:hypothetical protein AAE478_008947 [Parahypoxylon ruwenzoriense]